MTEYPSFRQVIAQAKGNDSDAKHKSKKGLGGINLDGGSESNAKNVSNDAVKRFLDQKKQAELKKKQELKETREKLLRARIEKHKGRVTKQIADTFRVPYDPHQKYGSFNADTRTYEYERKFRKGKNRQEEMARAELQARAVSAVHHSQKPSGSGFVQHSRSAAPDFDDHSRSEEKPKTAKLKPKPPPPSFSSIMNLASQVKNNPVAIASIDDREKLQKNLQMQVKRSSKESKKSEPTTKHLLSAGGAEPPPRKYKHKQNVEKAKLKNGMKPADSRSIPPSNSQKSLKPGMASKPHKSFNSTAPAKAWGQSSSSVEKKTFGHSHSTVAPLKTPNKEINSNNNAASLVKKSPRPASDTVPLASSKNGAQTKSMPETSNRNNHVTPKHVPIGSGSDKPKAPNIGNHSKTETKHALKTKLPPSKNAIDIDDLFSNALPLPKSSAPPAKKPKLTLDPKTAPEPKAAAANDAPAVKKKKKPMSTTDLLAEALKTGKLSEQTQQELLRFLALKNSGGIKKKKKANDLVATAPKSAALRPEPLPSTSRKAPIKTNMNGRASPKLKNVPIKQPPTHVPRPPKVKPRRSPTPEEEDDDPPFLAELRRPPMKLKGSHKFKNSNPYYAQQSDSGEEDSMLDEDEEEYDSDLADFIDDTEVDKSVKNELKETLKNVFRYDRNKYAYERDDDLKGMESSYRDCVKEEARSLKMGLLEDLEDIQREEEMEKRRKKMAKKE